MAEPRARLRAKGQVFQADDRGSTRSFSRSPSPDPSSSRGGGKGKSRCSRKAPGEQPAQIPHYSKFHHHPSVDRANTVSSFLTAFSHPGPHPQNTITALDEILTDFIIETCHYAALSASYSRRQKIKADDFKFALRRDDRLLGRVQEQQWREKKLKDDRKNVVMDEFSGEGAGGLKGLEGIAGEEGGKSKRGRKKRKAEGEDDGGKKRRMS